jgi:hypothetical protein
MESHFSLLQILLFIILHNINSVFSQTDITVDGIRTDWPGNPSCTIGSASCSLLLTETTADAGQSTNHPEYDISAVWGTWNTNYLFLRWDVLGTIGPSFINSQVIFICFNIPQYLAGTFTGSAGLGICNIPGTF